MGFLISVMILFKCLMVVFSIVCIQNESRSIGSEKDDLIRDLMKLQNDKKRKPAVMKRNPDLKRVKELNDVLDAILSTKQLEMLMEEIEIRLRIVKIIETIDIMNLFKECKIDKI